MVEIVRTTLEGWGLIIVVVCAFLLIKEMRDDWKRYKAVGMAGVGYSIQLMFITALVCLLFSMCGYWLGLLFRYCLRFI